MKIKYILHPSFFILWAALLLFPPAIVGQTTDGKKQTPPRYGDAGYVGDSITYTCKDCTLPSAVLYLAEKVKIRLKFPNPEMWGRVIVNVYLTDRPWNQALEEILSHHQLRAVWINDALTVVSSDKASEGDARLLSELLKDTPPIPPHVLSLPGPSRAKEAERYFKEGLGYYALCTDTDTDRALTRFAWALQLFDDLDYKGRQATVIYFIGRSLWELNRPQEALRAFQEGIALAHTGSNQRCESLLNVSIALVNLERFDKKDEALRQAEDFRQSLQEASARFNLVSRSTVDRLLDATLLTTFGRTFYGVGEYKKSVDMLQKALGQYLSVEDSERGSLETDVFLHKASLQLGNKADAQKYQEQIKNTLKGATDPRTLGGQKLLIGNLYLQSKDPTEAMRWYQDAAASVRSAGDYGLEVSWQRSQGRAYLALNQPAEARKAFEKALNLCQSNNDAKTAQMVQEDLKQF